MAKIKRIIGREILDSRGVPTVEAVVVTNESTGTAKIPSGTSTGQHEAKELRDGDEKRYLGKGVLKAVRNIEEKIQPRLLGMDASQQKKIDETMVETDGTKDKSALGANAILAVSLACARAQAAAEKTALYAYLNQLYGEGKIVMPVPQMNLVNGGVHASNNLSVQEFHVVPVGASSFSEALRWGVEVYQQLLIMAEKENRPTEVGFEGGIALKLKKSEEVFSWLVEAIEKAGYKPGTDIWLGVDVAATEFRSGQSGKYKLDGEELSALDLAYQYRKWGEDYPIISVEDPFSEDEWREWQSFYELKGKQWQIVGDDLYVTNEARIKSGAEKGAANAALIKPNQAGTLTETLAAIRVARSSGQNVVVSHRSGETEDTFIADLAVGVGAGQIKMGAPARSDRTAKYNRLLAIESLNQANLAHDLQRFLEQAVTNRY